MLTVVGVVGQDFVVDAGWHVGYELGINVSFWIAVVGLSCSIKSGDEYF
jgi:hypothetical protein